MAASTSGVKMKKPDQSELRRLMKEKQKQLGKERKIDSPLAKYLDEQLMCAICDCPVKAEPLWLAHVNSKAHKQNVEKLKNLQSAPKPTSFKRPPTPPKPSKRKAVDAIENPREEKKTKGSRDASSEKQNSQKSLSELIKTLENNNEDNLEDVKQDLPADFFDNKMEVDEDKSETAMGTTELPEGFFDNPVIDAKVRKVEYKDPADVEWEKFQREIADVSNKSQAIIAEEEEESTVERQIEEVDEQIQNWARVDALQRKKDDLEAKLKDVNMSGQSSDSSADEQDFEEFLDWRKKDSWR